MTDVTSNAGESKHSVSLFSRKKAEIEGVKEVESFDEATVILQTHCGEMTLEGEGLRVGTLDTVRGVISVTGQIRALYYSDTASKAKRPLFSRLFR